MSLRWLSKMVGGRVVPSVRRRVAPAARRDLTSEIEADALAVEHVWTRKLILDPAAESKPRPTVVALVDVGSRTDIAAWLDPTSPADDEPTIRTDWLLFPSIPEAVLMVAIEGLDGHGEAPGPARSFHFNLRLNADQYRREVQTLARSGRLGLTTAPLQVGPDWLLLSPCRILSVPTEPLRDFLREIPAPPIV
jgi:hypothetical protein